MPTEQSTQYALKQIIAGRTAADIARELGIDQNLLTQKLRKLPEYREYRRKQNAEFEALKKKALERVLAGETISDVARDMGVVKDRVGEWLRKMPEYREYREQATINENMTCPTCGGSMVKQELYYWRCSCGAEWWPPEKAIPENPDEWTVTPLARQTGTGDALALMRKLREEGKTIAEIARALNEAGYRTPTGTTWKEANTRDYMRLHGVITGDYAEQRAKVIEICKEMAGKQGISCADIADRLNMMGLRTQRNNPWNMHSVRAVIRGSLKLNVDLYGTKGVGIRKIKSIKVDEPHPWRRDEDIRRAKAKARHGK